MTTKRITKIEVIDPGSNPDVDSDFHTEVRERVIEYVTDLYGKDNVANIVTFNSLAAKSAFKEMCTIYQVPFASANKIASLVPPPIEGVDCTLEDIFNPQSDRYDEGAEFRAATSGADWKKIIEGAINIEGRYKSTGVHPCGVIMASRPLSSVMPLQVRQTDGRVITQWTYPECEEIGLIKFDFLGLDTVDLIQQTVEYIRKAGKTPPNMLDLIHGPMDDKKTYEMLARGDTIGIFQLGSQLVQDFLKVMKPTEFEDIAAATALMRPGPMGMLSHVRYANRKNGKEEITSLHPDFKGSPLDTILEKTQGLIVYQESILKISNEIAGLTLQEGDELRSAMGKKKMKVMMAMRPKFFEGAEQRGYSHEAVTKLWDTVAEFAKYGFNKSHSIAYAMNAYQAAYLKAHYPVEFMAALISQNVGNKEKILLFLKEARKMRLKVGSVDINVSDIKVAPDFKNLSAYDIVYGLSGVNAVSKDVASIIVKEREDNGVYISVQDLINRCSPLGVGNRKIYENLAVAGAFDSFGVTRRAVVESLPAMLGEAKTKATKGFSLFDFMGDDEEEGFGEMDISAIEEYSFVEKLQKEADVIGLYLTDHPLSQAGTGLSQGGVIPINKLLQSTSTTTAIIVGSVTDIVKKIRKQGGKTVQVTIDDGTGYITANLSRDIVKGIDKKNDQDRVKKFYTTGENEVSKEIEASALSTEFDARDDIQKNNVYILNVTFRPPFGEGQYGARVNDVRPITLSHDGSLPVRIRVSEKVDKNPAAVRARILKFAEALAKQQPGPYPLYAAIITDQDLNVPISDSSYYKKLIEEVRKTPKASAKGKAKAPKISSLSFEGKAPENTEEKADEVAQITRALPTPVWEADNTKKITEDELSDNLTYFDTGFRVAKNTKVEQILSDKFGGERIDFGIFNTSMREEG